jgi:hypothetical protein
LIVLSSKFSKAVLMFGLISSVILVQDAAAIPNQHPEVEGVPLTLDKTEGAAPLMVSITAPKNLADLLAANQKSNQHSKWGDGFSIDWGDGSGDGDAGRGKQVGATRGELGTHIYSMQGTYHVTASMYDFLPTDGHRTYWNGTCTVYVRSALLSH